MIMVDANYGSKKDLSLRQKTKQGRREYQCLGSIDAGFDLRRLLLQLL